MAPAHSKPGDVQCRLLALPAELRNRIWEFAVDCGAPLRCHPITLNIVPSYGTSIKTASAVTRVCRQIRAETLEMFYSTNTFAFQFDSKEARSKTVAWLDSIGDKDQLISRFEMVGPCNDSTWISGSWPEIKTITVPVAYLVCHDQGSSKVGVTGIRLSDVCSGEWKNVIGAITHAHTAVEEDAFWIKERIEAWLSADSEKQSDRRLWRAVVRAGSRLGWLGIGDGSFYLDY